MLDGGLRTVRRLVEAKVPKQSPAFDLGRGVLGPVMHAFDAFVADRIERIARQGGRTCVAFLGRDGFLSHRIWAQGGDTAARYLETNRRIGMMASAKTLDPLAELLSGIPLLDAPTFAEMTKFKSARVEAFFARYHNGRATGQDLVEALPDLLDEGKVADIADGLRAELMTYLRTVFADFDDCTDLVLIDLGYAGSIQKSLRRVFELEGVKARIHGLYLLTLDDGYGDGHEQDTFEGLISDIVVTPHVKRMMLRNIAVLEQMCCAPTGSVLGYRDGRVLYEADMQAADQHSTVQEIQAGVLAYVAAARTQAPELGVTPFADMRSTADHAVAMLGRLLLLPTDDELALLGQLQHDVNLGTTAVTPLLDDSLIGAYEVTQSFPDACMAAGPPMWLAGCFSALSPAQSFLYTLFGAGLLPTDIFGDVKCGQAEILLEDRNGKSSVVQVACYRTGFGEMRIRIPMSRAMSIGRITVPMVQLARAGVIHGPFLQGGETIKQAARSSDILKLDGAEVNWSAMEWCDGRYSATREDAALVIELPIQRLPIAMLSIGLVPHGQGRMLAVA
jgi:hypothetical protein